MKIINLSWEKYITKYGSGKLAILGQCLSADFINKGLSLLALLRLLENCVRSQG